MKKNLLNHLLILLLAVLTICAINSCSDDKNSIFEADSAACNSCGKCIEVCPSSAITMVSGKAVIDVAKCTKCGKCAIACPTDAIR